MSKYIFTPEMDEITGFGGVYEETARAMLMEGLRWMDEHPEAKLTYEKGKITNGSTEHAQLVDAVVAKGNTIGGATSLLLEMVLELLYYIKAEGWEAFEEMFKVRKNKRPTKPPLTAEKLEEVKVATYTMAKTGNGQIGFFLLIGELAFVEMPHNLRVELDKGVNMMSRGIFVKHPNRFIKWLEKLTM